ncbi:MAG: hypothetical protein H6557_19825 [Lewinellaceae bacterium]|nr:hypothetical protein [Lewinellaceae bacterium]
MEATLTLSPGELANSAWRLAENSLFKKHVDCDVYRELAAVYKLHDLVIETSSQASQLMNEVNVWSTFYLVPSLDMGLDETAEQELAIGFKQGWIPIFESWTSYEKKYLKQIDEALGLLE